MRGRCTPEHRPSTASGSKPLRVGERCTHFWKAREQAMSRLPEMAR